MCVRSRLLDHWSFLDAQLVNDWPSAGLLDGARRLVEIGNYEHEGEELGIRLARVTSGMRGWATHRDWPAAEVVRPGGTELAVFGDSPCGVDGASPTEIGDAPACDGETEARLLATPVSEKGRRGGRGAADRQRAKNQRRDAHRCCHRIPLDVVRGSQCRRLTNCASAAPRPLHVQVRRPAIRVLRVSEYRDTSHTRPHQRLQE